MSSTNTETVALPESPVIGHAGASTRMVVSLRGLKTTP
jgi:hypothetical protein